MSELSLTEWISMNINIAALIVLILMVILYIFIFFCSKNNENDGKKPIKQTCKPHYVIGLSLVLSILYTLCVLYDHGLLEYFFKMDSIKYNVSCFGENIGMLCE